MWKRFLFLSLLMLVFSTFASAQTARDYFTRGLQAFDLGNYELAITEYNNSIRLDSSNSDTYYNRGLAYDKKGNKDQAILDYTTSINIKPAADAYRNRGLAHMDKGNHDQAILDFGSAISLNPGKSDNYYDRGLAYDRKGNLDQAIIEYGHAIRLDPQYADAYYNRGLAYYDKGKYDQAILDYSSSIRINPAADAYNNRGGLQAARKIRSGIVRLQPGHLDKFLVCSGILQSRLALYSTKEMGAGENRFRKSSRSRSRRCGGEKMAGSCDRRNEKDVFSAYIRAVTPRSKPRPRANTSFPPYEGGVAAASADGVVLFSPLIYREPPPG